MRKIYIKMNVHNALKECDEGDEKLQRNCDPHVHDLLVPLFEALSKKQPTWTYVCRVYGDLHNSGSYYLYSRFTIMDGDEELGEVWASKNWRTGERRYAFDNPRLRSTRNRGSCTETKDLRKATNLILKNMYARTLPEVMTAERSKASSSVSNAIYNPQRDYRSLRERMIPDIMAFVEANWEAFEMTGSSTLDTKQQLRELYANAKRAEAADDLVTRKKTALVVERGNRLHVEHTSNPGTYHSYTLDELPAQLKQGVAVLKLCETGTLLDGVGVRTADKTFFILEGDN